MGWASTADYMQGTVMAFRSKEDAIAFVSDGLVWVWIRVGVWVWGLVLDGSGFWV